MNLCEAKTFCARSGRMVQCSYEENHDPAVPHAVMSEGVELVWTGDGAAEPMGIISELVHFVKTDSSEEPAVVVETVAAGALLHLFSKPSGLFREVKHDPQGRPSTWHLSAECGHQQRKR